MYGKRKTIACLPSGVLQTPASVKFRVLANCMILFFMDITSYITDYIFILQQKKRNVKKKMKKHVEIK